MLQRSDLIPAINFDQYLINVITDFNFVGCFESLNQGVRLNSCESYENDVVVVLYSIQGLLERLYCYGFTLLPFKRVASLCKHATTQQTSSSVGL